MRDEYGNKIHEYACPFALYENWNEATKLVHHGNKYRISPEKVARLYDYNMSTIDNALYKFRNFGSGKYTSVKTYQSIRTKTQELCEKQRNDMLNLKRGSIAVSQFPPIYCDLDGVLADFDYSVRTLFNGLSPDQIPPRDLWKNIDEPKLLS